MPQNKSTRELHKPVFRSTYRAFVVCFGISLKTAEKKCTKVKDNHDHVKSTSMPRVVLTFDEMNVDTGNERLAGPKVGSTHCTLHLEISSHL